MTMSTQTPSRSSWLSLWGALTSALVVYAFIAPLIASGVEPHPSLALIRGVLLSVSVVAAALGLLLLSRAPRTPEGLAPPASFMLRSIVAMALFESVTLFGFLLTFLGAPPSQVWLWSGASLTLMLAVALPTGLGYWNEWDLTASGGTQGQG